MIPAISIVMSVYNGETYLKEAIDSILSQSFSDFEFIIIDDGSTDNTVSIIKKYNDNRIVFISQQNTGLAKALNNGIKQAKAPLIARMDADDISLPDRLLVQLKFMLQHPNCVACGSWADIIDKDGNFVYTKKTIEKSNEIKQFLRKSKSKGLPNTPFFHSSVMFRIKAFIQIGGYTEYMKRAQDVVLFNKMSLMGDFYNIPIVLLKYRINPGAIGGGKISKFFLGELLIKTIEGQKISEEVIMEIDNSISKSDLKEREYSYYIYLAKKYLIKNNNPALMRVNLKNALKIKPYSFIPRVLYFISFIPRQLIYKFRILL